MAAPPRHRAKTAFKKVRTIGPVHTGGPVAASRDGTRLVTCLGEEAILSDIATGEEVCRFAGDTGDITAFCMSYSSSHLLVFSQSLSLRIYEVPSTPSLPPKLVQPTRVIARAHDAPVHVCTTDPTSTYLASGSADGIVKVWDIRRGFVTHVFKGHGGVISALAFNYPRTTGAVQLREEKMHLLTASVDTRIRIFDLVAARESGQKGGAAKPTAVLEGHHSVPRGLDVSEDGRWLVSGGRDSVVLLWDLAPQGATGKKNNMSDKGTKKAIKPVLVKTFPILERVEALGLLLPHEELAGHTTEGGVLRFFTAGEKGLVRIWDAHAGTILHTFGQESAVILDEQEEQRQIVQAIYIPSSSMIISVHADQNILIHSLSTLSLSRQIIGFNDEIVDATFLSSGAALDSSHLALATNSSLIRIYSTTTQDARLLEGHKDIVLSLDRGYGGQMLASGSKDRSVRLWSPVSHPNSDDWGWACVGICEGHAESVGAVAMSRKVTSDGEAHAARFLFSGSQDRTIKMWDLSSLSIDNVTAAMDPMKCRSLTTFKAHEKDINALDVAPNDRFLASGSQDKTAKVYEIEFSESKGAVHGNLKLVGVCKGHKRGVWTVRFGRAERVLATGSGDKTIRLWNLDDFTCVKTFEGHTNSVLRIDFLNAGTQMISTASDGLVKLWNIRDEECITTMDGHEDKVWALAVSADESIVVSGAADSVVNFWQDCTEEQENEQETKRADMIIKEQDFNNYLALRDYRKAISLALAMEQPGRLLSMFRDLRSTSLASGAPETSVTGHPAVDAVIRTLAGSELSKLLQYLRDWNARAKTSAVAQDVLYAVVKLRTAEDVVAAFGSTTREIPSNELDSSREPNSAADTALKEIIDGLIPYTERHLTRMERLVQESYVVDYLLSEMDTLLDEMDDSMAVDGA